MLVMILTSFLDSLFNQIAKNDIFKTKLNLKYKITRLIYKMTTGRHLFAKSWDHVYY